MMRPVKLALAALAVTAVLTGVTYAAVRPVPENQPAVVLQNTTMAALPGDTGALEAALAAVGPVKYKVLVVQGTDGEDKTDYLDRVAAEWKQPAPDTLLLILFTQDNYDIRFYMGANFRANGVSVEEMLSLVRAHYFAGVRKGDVAGGLVNLITAVNGRMSGKAVEPSKATVQVPDPFSGGRQPAAGQVELATKLLSGYLEQFKSPAVAEQSRLKEYRIHVGDIQVAQSADTKLRFMMTYDVLPAVEQSNWWAGNGTAGENGWIVRKFWFVDAALEGGVWKLTGLATGP